MANSVVIERHFKTLKRVLKENDLLNKRDKIFNTDESGINMGLRQGKVVVSRGSKQAHSQSKGSRDHITVTCAISAAGTALPPMIIFEKSFPSSAYVTQGPINALYAKSPNGYMDEELFYSWFSKLFVPQTNHLWKRILIIDGHGSHMSLKLIDSAIENNVILYCLPPHTTHLLQPLDISVYKPLKNHFSTITDFIVLAGVTHGATQITINKTNFPILLKEAFEKTISMKTIISGFHTSGICPFNPEAILKERLMPSDDATGIVNQVQQATPPDKSTEQNQAITPATSQGFSTLPGACQNSLVSTGLISPDLAEILQPVKHDEKIKPPRVIIEERVLTEDDWREKIAAKFEEKKQKELRLKNFRERKEIRKSEAAAKANKKAKET